MLETTKAMDTEPSHGKSGLGGRKESYTDLLGRKTSTIEQDQDSKHVTNLVHFEELLKSHEVFKELFKMSPSIPHGLDLNCTQVNLDDLSTIICQSMLSTAHIMGLKEHGYMDMESKVEIYKHFYKRQPPVYKNLNPLRVDDNESMKNIGRQTEEFYCFKQDNDVLNSAISVKEIEAELLRLDHYNFQVSFNNYKGPNSSELLLIKDGQKNIKVERKIITSPKHLECIEKLMPADLESIFYHDLNNELIQRIYQLRAKIEQQRGMQIDLAP